MRLSLRQLQYQLLLLCTLCAALAACGGETEPEGFCLFDIECNEGLCDPVTRRCVRSADQGYLTDTELDRKLDMMVDMVVIDLAITDLAVPDAQVLNPIQPDQSLSLIDAELPNDHGTASELTTDALITSDGEMNTSAADQGLPVSAVRDTEVETEMDADAEPTSADSADPS